MSRRQSGVALISVLLVFALAAVIAAEILSRTSFAIRSTGSQLIAAQAYEYALGGEAYARQLLTRDFEEDRKNGPRDHLDEHWAKSAQVYEFDQGVLEISIRDLQSQLNINNLVVGNAEANPEPYRRLLNNLNLDTEWVIAWQDWIDPDILPRQAANEDEGYLALKTPYRAANRPLAHLSELVLARGMTWSAYQQLSQHLVALPQATQVNINTASAATFAHMLSEVDAAVAERLVDARGAQGFASFEEFTQLEVLAGVTINPSDFTLQSQFFEVRVRASFAERVAWLTSILYRDAQTGMIRVISRERTQPFAIRAQTNNKDKSS